MVNNESDEPGGVTERHFMKERMCLTKELLLYSLGLGLQRDLLEIRKKIQFLITLSLILCFKTFCLSVFKTLNAAVLCMCISLKTE